MIYYQILDMSDEEHHFIIRVFMVDVSFELTTSFQVLSTTPNLEGLVRRATGVLVKG